MNLYYITSKDVRNSNLMLSTWRIDFLELFVDDQYLCQTIAQILIQLIIMYILCLKQ